MKGASWCEPISITWSVRLEGRRPITLRDMAFVSLDTTLTLALAPPPCHCARIALRVEGLTQTMGMSRSYGAAACAPYR